MSMHEDAVAMDDLPDSAKTALLDIVALLSRRFTGKIELECRNGGVRNLREVRDRRPGDASPSSGRAV